METLDPPLPNHRVVKETSQKDIELVLDLVEGRLTCDPSRPKWRPPVEPVVAVQQFEEKTVFVCRSCKAEFNNIPSQCPYCSCGMFDPRKA